ncbi:hypothetical protein J5J83_19725 [Azoarcus sp. L1K30]|uniref:hypothetical protein n=1 Tax=Azoarcus sp. L1K30 TaxID=2820277 RepID=UPI001B8225A7|nr:hypothetical protein [Azoarcus sp. L1K30]MBR0568357.1 hypothetical protein [Azoarcus sp. L1K30]
MSDPLSPVILNKVSALPVGSIKSVQTGIVSAAMSSGAGQDTKYLDVTISAVDPAKCIVRFVGGIGDAAQNAMYKAGSGFSAYEAFCRLTSSTNLRIHLDASYGTYVHGQWKVEEFY